MLIKKYARQRVIMIKWLVLQFVIYEANEELYRNNH